MHSTRGHALMPENIITPSTQLKEIQQTNVNNKQIYIESNINKVKLLLITVK
jgi:hypothetical protein